jgi:hypothetical protein
MNGFLECISIEFGDIYMGKRFEFLNLWIVVNPIIFIGKNYQSYAGSPFRLKQYLLKHIRLYTTRTFHYGYQEKNC